MESLPNLIITEDYREYTCLVGQCQTSTLEKTLTLMTTLWEVDATKHPKTIAKIDIQQLKT